MSINPIYLVGASISSSILWNFVKSRDSEKTRTLVIEMECEETGCLHVRNEIQKKGCTVVLKHNERRAEPLFSFNYSSGFSALFDMVKSKTARENIVFEFYFSNVEKKTTRRIGIQHWSIKHEDLQLWVDGKLCSSMSNSSEHDFDMMIG